MATSSLKSVSSAVPPELLGAGNSDYAERYQEAKDAEDRLMSLLESRQNSGLDPSMLALAGEFLDPGRTGSFGEALGRGAKSYAQMQGLEDKRLQENAMARMQLAGMNLDRAKKSALMSQLPRPAGAAPTAGTTSLAGAPSSAGGATTQRDSGATPPPMMYQGMEVTPDLIRTMKLIDKETGDALESEFKLRLEMTGSQPGFIFNKLNAKVTPVTPPGGADVEIRFPERGGETLLGATEDLIALRNARNSSNLKEIDRIYDKLKFGAVGAPKGETTGSGGTTPVRSGNTGAPSVSERKEQDVRADAISRQTAEYEARKTGEFLDLAESERDNQFVAARIMNMAKNKPQLYGLLKKPGIGPALASFARDRGESGQYAITKENLEDFLRKVNYKTTDEDLAELSSMTSDLARLHFGFRKTLLSGQGAVSNIEDYGVRQIQGTTSDPAMFLVQMAQITGRKAQFNSDVADKFQDYRRDKGRNKTIIDFKDTDEYKDLKKGYEGWLVKTYNLPKELLKTPSERGQPTTPVAKKPEGSPVPVTPGARPPATSPAPAGVRQEIWNAMKPEERALWQTKP
jgi:hypothetical protein